jgi:hypothetical protein
MKSLLLTVLLCLGITLPTFGLEEDLAGQDSLGKLKLGLGADAVIKVLGKPASKGKDVEWEAIGEWVQEWKFPDQGIQLNMASEKKGGAKKVLMITATSPCKLATARGIALGGTEAAVKKAYGNVRDKENSVAGKTFVAGSIYGGVIFQFKDGKVSEIFIGAAAE